MEVAFLADAFFYRIPGGSTRYAVELARHLARRDDVNLRLVSLCPPPEVPPGGLEALSVRHSPSPLPRPLQYLLWHTLGWPGPAGRWRAQADLVHTPSLFVPPRGKTPLVVTVLDLSFLLFPQYATWRIRLTMSTGLRRAVKDADAYIALSEQTAQDLVRVTGVPRGRVHVVPLAADERFRPTCDPAVAARYGIDEPYVLYVGTLEPRKNLDLLLHAFAAVKDRGVKLVLAGAKGWLYDSIFTTLERLNLTSCVIWAGFVANEDLPALYSGARAFVYPSLFEGFGLPVLEAMQCGVPVITTNVSSLPEVAGDAALLVAPDDVAGLTRSLDRLLAEPALRDELRGRGLEQASRFSWRRTAEMTAEVYRAVLG